MDTIITRRQLYDRVWQEPITHLAKEFGISDVGLRKACQRHSIPTPTVGYWTKLAHGKRVTLAKLPDPDDDHPIRIWRGSSGEEPEEIAEARAKALAAVPALATNEAVNPIVEQTAAKLSSGKPDRNGFVRTSGPNLISVTVTQESVQRASELLRRLVHAGEAAGLALKKNGARVAWESQGETVEFEIVAAADKVEHVATDQELVAHAKWQRDCAERTNRYGYPWTYGEPKIPKWEDQYNGRLAVRLEKVRIKSGEDPWGRPIRGTFADSRARDVARAIPAIIAAVAATAAAKRNNAAYDERRRLEAEVARQRWQEEERRRYEWQRAQAFVAEQIELEHQAEDLEQWLKLVRAFGPLDPRGRRLVELVEQRLGELRSQSTAGGLERQLEAAHLFSDLK